MGRRFRGQDEWIVARNASYAAQGSLDAPISSRFDWNKSSFNQRGSTCLHTPGSASTDSCVTWPGRVRVISQDGFGHITVTLVSVIRRMALTLVPQAHVQKTSDLSFSMCASNHVMLSDGT